MLLEPFGEPRLVLEGLELALRVAIVVGNMEAAVALGHPKVGEQQRYPLGGHRRSPVGVDPELPLLDSFPPAD